MRTVYTVRLLQVIAAIASLALIMWSLGLTLPLRFVEAANLTSVSDTLSDSDPGALSNHAISFTLPNGSVGLAAGQSFTVTFPTGFNLSTSSLAVEDLDLEIDGVDATVVAGAPGAGQWGYVIATQDLTFTAGAGESLAAGTTTVVKIGTNADDGTDGSGDTQITNPSATQSYEFTINVNSGQDVGMTRVAIIDNVDVTASVDTLFTFTVEGVAGGQSVNGTSTTGSTSATAIPFGLLQAGVATTAAQDLTVTTNATQGYVITVTADQDLMSSTGAVIDGFVDGSYTTTPTAWAAPTATVGNASTYGHWGLTSDDGTTTRSSEFGLNEWASPSTTPVVVMSNDGPADGTTAGVGTARVGYQVQISSLQEAADDYTTTLTYVATPVF